jgi:alpha-tubulin suppressor-like RCC1 family protein
MRRVGAALLALAAFAFAYPPGASATAHTALAWGFNEYGQIGDGSVGGSVAKPTAVGGLNDVAAIAGGTYHSLALLGDGTAMAWGADEFGQLGTTTIPTDIPQPVSGLSGITAVAAGALDSLALLNNGKVMAWGLNDHGQLGDGTHAGPEHCSFSQPCAKVPVEVSGLSGVIAVAAGFDHGLAALSNGTVMAWGNNSSGQLGNGTTEESDVPVEVKGLSEVIAVAAGESFSLALLKGGTVEAWGYNAQGELGDGKTERSTVPVAVSGLAEVKAISAGTGTGLQSLALLGDGTVRAWGSNVYGQLGDGTTEDKHVPVAVSGLSGVSAVAAGTYHSLALLGNGTVMAWGNNSYHQLADGTAEDKHLPNAVAGVSGVTGIGAGGYHSLTFTAPTPPEFGRCVKLAKGVKGRYSTAGCTSSATAEKFGFEWEQGPGAKAGFTTKFKAATSVALETVGKKRIACTGETGKGEYTGLKSVGHVALTLTGCELPGQKCTTGGFAAGEIVTNTLEGELGWENKAKKAVALDLLAAVSGQPVAAFTCGAAAVSISGSVLVKVAAGKTSATETLKYSGTAGKQKPEHFEGGPRDVLETSFKEGLPPFEQTALLLTAVRTAEENIEENWFA